MGAGKIHTPKYCLPQFDMFGGGPSQSHVSPCSLLQPCVTWRTMPRGSHAPSATSYTSGPEDLQTSDNEDVMNYCIILGLGKDRGQICTIQLSRIETYSDIDGACLPPTPHFPFLLIIPLGNPSHPRAPKPQKRQRERYIRSCPSYLWVTPHSHPRALRERCAILLSRIET